MLNRQYTFIQLHASVYSFYARNSSFYVSIYKRKKMIRRFIFVVKISTFSVYRTQEMKLFYCLSRNMFIQVVLCVLCRNSRVNGRSNHIVTMFYVLLSISSLLYCPHAIRPLSFHYVHDKLTTNNEITADDYKRLGFVSYYILFLYDRTNIIVAES